MVLSLQDPVVQSYIVYSAILALKVLVLALFTRTKRRATGAYANPEDAAFLKGKVILDDPEVERVRRAHRNDLENVVPFWVLGALYAATAPAAAAGAARLLFRLYAAGRALHTLVYAARPLPQPARAVAFSVPYLIMWYMGAQVVLHYWTAF